MPSDGVLLTARETPRDPVPWCTSRHPSSPHTTRKGGNALRQGLWKESSRRMHPAQSHTDQGWEEVGRAMF